jgi:P pilus assembly chaperone PapD
MRRLILVLLILPSLSACASQHEASVKRSIDAVVQDESQRQKVLSAINAGDTPADAMAKVSDGPKHETSGPQ